MQTIRTQWLKYFPPGPDLDGLINGRHFHFSFSSLKTYMLKFASCEIYFERCSWVFKKVLVKYKKMFVRKENCFSSPKEVHDFKKKYSYERNFSHRSHEFRKNVHMRGNDAHIVQNNSSQVQKLLVK
jgi:hypothetical protein